MKRILTLGIVLLTVNSLLPAQEITFSKPNSIGEPSGNKTGMSAMTSGS